MGADSRILKHAAPLPGRRIEARVWDADLRVREMVAAADAQARAVVAEAHAARERVQEEARASGRAQGAAEAAATLARAAAERDRLLRDADGEVARLAIAVARKVLGRELADSGGVPALAQAALAEARSRREVALRISPADAAELRAVEGRLAAILSSAPLAIREDPSVPAGGVVVETEAGRIDGGIEAQLEALARALEEALR